MLHNLFWYKLLEYFAYYAGIMLDSLACLLCLKLSWHNRCKPNATKFIAVQFFQTSHAKLSLLRYVKNRCTMIKAARFVAL